MKRTVYTLIAFVWLAGIAFGQQSAVDAVNDRNPSFLRINDHLNDAKFLQCVVAAIPGAGFLSKSGGENGFTWPNGVRTSHDAIAFADGSRVDVIAGSDQPGVPGSPSWGVIPQHEWRLSNVYMPANAVPQIANCAGGTEPPDPVKPPVPQPQPVNLQPLIDEITALRRLIDALGVETVRMRGDFDEFSTASLAASDAARVAAESARDQASSVKATVENMATRIELANTNIDRALQQLAKPVKCSGRVRLSGTTDFTCTVQ